MPIKVKQKVERVIRSKYPNPEPAKKEPRTFVTFSPKTVAACSDCVHGNHGLSNFRDKVLCMVDGPTKCPHVAMDYYCPEFKHRQTTKLRPIKANKDGRLIIPRDLIDAIVHPQNRRLSRKLQRLHVYVNAVDKDGITCISITNVELRGSHLCKNYIIRSIEDDGRVSIPKKFLEDNGVFIHDIDLILPTYNVTVDVDNEAGLFIKVSKYGIINWEKFEEMAKNSDRYRMISSWPQKKPAKLSKDGRLNISADIINRLVSTRDTFVWVSIYSNYSDFKKMFPENTVTPYGTCLAITNYKVSHAKTSVKCQITKKGTIRIPTAIMELYNEVDPSKRIDRELHPANKWYGVYPHMSNKYCEGAFVVRDLSEPNMKKFLLKKHLEILCQ